MHRESAANDPFSEAPIGLARLGTDGAFQHVNRQLCEVLGYRAEQLTQMRFQDIAHSDDRSTDGETIAYLLRHRSGAYNLIKRLQCHDGSTLIAHLSIRSVQQENGDGDHFIVALQNMSKTQQRLEQLERQTRHDRLTGILNRAGFTQCVHEAFRAYQRHDTGFALAYLDLDGFKTTNDTLGHVTGDMLLKGVAQRLSKSVGRDGVVARVGGDEFAILLSQITTPDLIQNVTDRVHAAFAAPFIANRLHVTTSVSIGFARCPEDARSVRALLQHADKQMYARKKATLHSEDDNLSAAPA